MKIEKIGSAKILEDAIRHVAEANDTADFLVIRSFRDAETGYKNIEYWTSQVESRVWVVGALYYLAHKLLSEDPDNN